MTVTPWSQPRAVTFDEGARVFHSSFDQYISNRPPLSLSKLRLFINMLCMIFGNGLGLEGGSSSVVVLRWRHYGVTMASRCRHGGVAVAYLVSR